MNWRRLLNLDPAGKSGGVVAARIFDNGRIEVDLDQLETSMSLVQTPGQLMRQLMNYNPPDQTGKTLADKENKRVHGLHLDDYQPRSHEYGVQRITFERAYPPRPEWNAEEDGPFHLRPDTDWVDYRNHNPMLYLGACVLPPMRDALADLLEHLHAVEAKLAEQDLVAVEVAVEHEPTLSKRDGSGQGWNFAVHMLAVPRTVLHEELARFNEQRARWQAEQDAKAKRRD